MHTFKPGLSSRVPFISMTELHVGNELITIFSSSAQPLRVWLQTLWATTPRRPLLSVDLTTACPSQCPMCRQTRPAKQVGVVGNYFSCQTYLSFPSVAQSLGFFSCSLFSPMEAFIFTLSHPRVQPSVLSVVCQPADEGTGLAVVKRRRVTAEMEGKYIINMPKGTTPRTRRILAQQAKKGRPGPVASPTTCLNNADAHHC